MQFAPWAWRNNQVWSVESLVVCGGVSRTAQVHIVFELHACCKQGVDMQTTSRSRRHRPGRGAHDAHRSRPQAGRQVLGLCVFDCPAWCMQADRCLGSVCMRTQSVCLCPHRCLLDSSLPFSRACGIRSLIPWCGVETAKQAST